MIGTRAVATITVMAAVCLTIGVALVTADSSNDSPSTDGAAVVRPSGFVLETMNEDRVQKLVDDAVESLQERYPELAPITIQNPSASYRDSGTAPVGAAADLLLTAPTDLTMSLVKTRVEGGVPIWIEQPSQIKNLRGLQVFVSLDGVITSLLPLPFMDDVDHPEDVTTVELID